MTDSLRSPVSGLAVNNTPDTSLCTISCTTTASATLSLEIPLRIR